MSSLNIKEVDFYTLDLDKYIDFLLNKYSLFSTVWEIAYLDEFIEDLQLRNYYATLHYIKTRNAKLPINIQQSYDEKITHFKNQRNKYDGLHVDLLFFESVIRSPDKDYKGKKYTFFSKQEMKEIKINTYWLNFWIVENKDYFNDLVQEIEIKKKSSPLKDVTFYQNQKDYIINNFDFIYLSYILEGAFIYNLDSEHNALVFSSEIEKIKLLIYLSEKIQGDNQKHQLTKAIQWNGSINALATIFHTLKEHKMLEASDENIKRLLINSFVDSEQKELSKHYLNEIFVKSKGKLNSNVVEKILPLISVLNKNSPKE